MNIKELAEQAGANFEHIQWVERDLAPLFERFADLVAAHEREKCAKLCDNWECDEDFVDNIADAIRARSKA
jgi:hypothetical protein